MKYVSNAHYVKVANGNVMHLKVTVLSDGIKLDMYL